MAINYPTSLDGTTQFPQPNGTQLLTSPDHAALHTNTSILGTLVENMIGVTAGTNMLGQFIDAAGEFVPAVNSSNVFQDAMQGTFNNSTFGTPTLTNPTTSGGTLQSTIQNNGTINGGAYNGGTLGTPVFQVWNNWVQANETPTVLGTLSSQGVNIGTLTVAATAANKYDKGDKIQFTQNGTTLYGYVYSVPSGTTILATGGTDYVIGTTAITNFNYSKASSPNAFPGWFNFTPGQQYGGTAPTTSVTRVAQFKLNGNECLVRFYDSYSTAGTVNQGTINQPIPSIVSSGQIHDPGVGIFSGNPNTSFFDQAPQACGCVSNTTIVMQSGPIKTSAIYINVTYPI